MDGDLHAPPAAAPPAPPTATTRTTTTTRTSATARTLPAAASAVAVLGLAGWLEAGVPGGSARQAVFSMVLVAAPALAALAGFGQARRSPAGPDRSGWLLLSFAAATWALASVVYAGGLLLVGTPPFPSVADALYLGFAVPVVLALAAFTRGSLTATSRTRSLVDGLAVSSAVLFIAWATVLGPVYRAPIDAPLARAAVLAYPAVDVTIAVLVLALAVRRDLAARASFNLVGAGLVLLAVSDSVYVRQNVLGVLRPGEEFWQAGYAGAFLLIALAARGGPGESSGRRSVPLGAEVLTLAPAAAAVLLVALGEVDVREDPVLLVTGLLALVATLTGQVLVLLESRQLRLDLERRVADRTAEATATRERLLAITRSAGDAFVVIDREGVVQAWNAAATRLFWCAEEDAVGRPMADFVPERLREAHRRGVERVLGPDGVDPTSAVVEVPALRSDGTEVPVELTLARWHEDGQPYVSGIIRDVSTRKAAERRSAKERARVELLEKVAVAANEAPSVAQALEHALGLVAEHGGWAVGHALVVPETEGDSLPLVSTAWHLTDPEALRAFVLAAETLSPRHQGGAVGTVVRTAEPLWICPVADHPDLPHARVLTQLGLQTFCGFPILSRDRVVGVLELYSHHRVRAEPEVLELMRHVGTQLGRVIERERSETRLTRLALHDPLTSLANRRLFADRLEQAVLLAERRGVHAAVLLLDLDSFKEVNDSLGHQAGDELLRQVAFRLATTSRGSDTVARLGGDEFAVAMADIRTEEDAQAAARRVLATLRTPFAVLDRQLSVAASIGLALSGPDATTGHELLRNADLAMYSAKREGPNRYAFFHPGMHSAVVDRLEIEADLQRAVAAEGLELAYQPIVDSGTGQVLSREALLRWTHPERGPIPPMQFIPVAESTGLILRIGAWVLRRACEDAVRWRGAGQPRVAVSVNLSAREVRPELYQVVLEALEGSGLPASALVLEITESLLMEESPAAAACLRDLDALGVRLSVDDFGTGHSSLGRLRSLPVRELKIDRSFVTDLGRDPAADAMVDAVIAMARALELGIVAEGVETAEQLALLADRGCDAVQGYLLQRPGPVGEQTSDALDLAVHRAPRPDAAAGGADGAAGAAAGADGADGDLAQTVPGVVPPAAPGVPGTPGSGG